MAWNSMVFWKKSLIYIGIMLLLLFITDIFENGEAGWIYGAIISLTLVVIIITYLTSKKSKLNFFKIKDFMISHKVTSSLLAIALIFSLFNFFLNTTLVREVPIGQGLPNEGQTIYGCKTCSGLLPFIGSFSCSTSIFNCIPKFLVSFIGYSIIAVIIGLIIDLIIRKIKSKKY